MSSTAQVVPVLYIVFCFAYVAISIAGMDRWEDADDDVQSCKQKGKVARLGIAGFVRAAGWAAVDSGQQQCSTLIM